MNFFETRLFSPFLTLGVFALLLLRCSSDGDDPVVPLNEFLNLNSSEIEVLKQLNSDEGRLNAAKVHGSGSIILDNNTGGRAAAVEVESPVTLSRTLGNEALARLDLLTHETYSTITGWELTAINAEAVDPEESYLTILTVDGNYYKYNNGDNTWGWGYYYLDTEVTSLTIDLGSETEMSWEISLLELDSLILTGAEGKTFHFSSNLTTENSPQIIQLSELYNQLIGKTYVVSYHAVSSGVEFEEFNTIGEKRDWGVIEPDGSNTIINQGIPIFKYQFTRDSVIVELYYVREENLANALDIPDNEKISQRFDRNVLSIKSFADSYPYLSLERGRNKYDLGSETTKLNANMSFLYGLDSEIQFVQASTIDCGDCYIWALISEDDARAKLRALYGG